MPVINSQPPRKPTMPDGIDRADKILDPFTIPANQQSDLDPSQYIEQLFKRWEEGSNRHTAADALIGPDGNFISRLERPDDFSNLDKESTPMAPSTEIDTSPLWNTKLDLNFPPSSIYLSDELGMEDHEVARVIPNKFPFFDIQEVVIFPSSKLVSVSQLNDQETQALAALMKDRYEALYDDGYEHVYFVCQRGRDGGATLDHFHVQIFGSKTPFAPLANIWANEKGSQIAHYDFQSQDGDLIISNNEQRQTSTYTPYAAKFPLAMDVAYMGSSDGGYTHFHDMTVNQVADWIKSLSEAVHALESVPLKDRPNGVWGYSFGFGVPPKDHTISPMTWNIDPGKRQSLSFMTAVGFENPVRPELARDTLARYFTPPSL